MSKTGATIVDVGIVLGDHDPGSMDGRAIARELSRVAHASPHSFTQLSFWAGAAIARLLEYQRLLERAGVIEVLE